MPQAFTPQIGPVATLDVEQQTIGLSLRRVMPLLGVMYLIAYFDR